MGLCQTGFVTHTCHWAVLGFLFLSYLAVFFLSVDVHPWVCVGAHVRVWGECAYVCMYVEVRGQPHIHMVVLRCHSLFILFWCRVLQCLELLKLLGWLASKLQGIQLPFPPQNWDYNEPSWQAVCVRMGSGAWTHVLIFATNVSALISCLQ